MNNKNYLIIAGGTGGHVIPAVNFGNFIIKKGYNCTLFVDQRGKKYTNSFNGHIIIIKSSHLSYNFLGKIKAISLLVFGFFQSLKYTIHVRPKICISFGSYATFMPLLVLIFFRIFYNTKIFLHEQNSIIGKVNILFSPFANKIFLNFSNTLKINNNLKKKSFVVGLPFNHNTKLKKNNKIINENKYFKMLICGGSQGAINLNKIIIALFDKFPKNILENLYVSIQSPASQKEEIEIFLKKLSIKYEIKNFFHNFIEKLYENELLITRAGAGTINDVILTKIPTIFVPLPISSENHQFYNANFLKEKNAALLIEQKDLSSDESLSIIISLINDYKKKAYLRNNLKKIESFDTNKLIYHHMNNNV